MGCGLGLGLAGLVHDAGKGLGGGGARARVGCFFWVLIGIWDVVCRYLIVTVKGICFISVLIQAYYLVTVRFQFAAILWLCGKIESFQEL